MKRKQKKQFKIIVSCITTLYFVSLFYHYLELKPYDPRYQPLDMKTSFELV